MSNKEQHLQSKLSAFQDNIKVHAQELGQQADTLFEAANISYLDKVGKYDDKNFQSTERLVQTIYRQRGLRAISGSNNIFHQLHLLRNS